MSEELCGLCGEPTGRAGQGDDSIYCGCDAGPFCERCWFGHWCNERRLEHLTPAERAVLDAAVAYSEAMERRWKGPPSEDIERKGEVRLALNVLLGSSNALVCERRGETNVR